MKIVCKYPDGKVSELDSLPTVAELPKKYARATWIHVGKNTLGMDVYRLDVPSPMICFHISETETIVLPAEAALQNLPIIPCKRGMSSSWDLPKNLTCDTEVWPVYKVNEYIAECIDDSGKRVVKFSVDKPLKLPPITPRAYYTARWVFNKDPSDEDYYHNQTIIAEYSPLEITFVYDGKKEVQYTNDLNPPKLTEQPWVRRCWKIPKDLKDNIVLTPSETYATYSVNFYDVEDKLIGSHNFSRFASLFKPPIPKRNGYVGFWDGFDASKPCDQEVKMRYRPVHLICYYPDGSEKEIEYNMKDCSNLDQIEGYIWAQKLPDGTITSKWHVGSEDIKLIARKVILFALFYVDEELRFCVPYTTTDKHYLDEMLKLNTVPRDKRTRTYGVWKQISSPFNFSRYVADYTIPQPDLPRDTTTVNWDLKEIANVIRKNGYITIDGTKIHLLSTYFSKITGITKENLHEYISLNFKDWLRRERIPFEDHIKEPEIVEKSDGSLILTTSRSRFWIGYHPDFDDALSFLEEYDIYFITPKITRKMIGCLPGHYLKNKVEIESDSEEDYEAGYEELYPVNRIIPSRKCINTEYSHLEKQLDTVDLKKLDDVIDRNNQVIDVFNTRFCPECEFTILNENDRTVSLDRYHGNAIHFEIPQFVTLDAASSERYRIIEIGNGAFSKNTRLTEIIFPISLEIIGERAFFGCRGLTEIEFPDNLKIICAQAFNGCKFNRVIIPKSVTKVGSFVFSNISELVLEGDLKELDPKAVGKNCKITRLSEEKVCTDDSDQPNSNFDQFWDSLKDYQKQYIKAVYFEEDISGILELSGKRSSTIELEINQKISDIIDDDEGLFEDGFIIEDYLKELKKVMEESDE